MLSMVIVIKELDISGKHLSVKAGESCGYVECRITYTMHDRLGDTHCREGREGLELRQVYWI